MNEEVIKAQKDLDDFINSLSGDRKAKMEQLQWRINCELRKYKNPVARMNRMVEMFYEGVADFDKALQDYRSYLKEEK